MRPWKTALAYVAWIGFLLSSGAASAQQVPSSGGSSTAQLVASEPRASLDGLPDSPGAIRAKEQGKDRQQSDVETKSSPSAAPPQTEVSPAPPQSKTSPPPPQEPVGTAVAEPLTVSGMAASQPAGVAIAPAKQHRTRTIVLRVGAIVGAGVAVGTVVALTQATPSKPPGAR